MRVNPKSKTLRQPLFLLVFVAVVLLINGCRTDQVEVPDLTGPSGANLFLTIDATPDHLIIHKPGGGRDHSTITIQLKNQQGQGVPNAKLKIRITNSEGGEVNIGRLSQLECITDAGGFCRVTYSAPNSAEQPVTTRIYILAVLLDPSYVNQVTARHALDLEFSQPPINCVIGPGAPTPAFTFTPASPAINQPVCFDAQSSTDNGVIVAAVWNFGDGGTGSGLNVCHTFTHEGSFNVTLTVQDNDRNCASLTQLVVVTSSNPTCAFTISPTPVQINVDEIFNASTSLDVDNDITGFRWDFGDGHTANGKSVHHTFTDSGSFIVTLTVTDSQGNQSICTQTVAVSIGQPPECSFTVNPTSPIINQSVSFDGSASSDPDGTITTVEWNFGDGGGFVNTNGDLTVSHTYTVAGTYTATLRLTDNDGNVTTCTNTVTVTKGEPPDCGTILVTPSGTITKGTTVTVDASGATDPDGTIVNYKFNFGEGGGFVDNGSNAVATHTYNNVGTFTVTVRLTDNDGNVTDCAAGTVTVGAGQPPTCSFTFAPNAPQQNQNVNFDASLSSDPDGTIVSYEWNFGEGAGFTAPSASPLTSHTYTTAGTFTVTLRITDNDGNVVTCTQQVTVTSCTPTVTAPTDATVNICPGTPYNITGTNFTGATNVTISSSSGSQSLSPNVSPGFTVTNSTTIAVTPPSGFATNSTSFTITVTTACGTSEPATLSGTCP